MKKNYVCFCLILFVMVFGILTFSCDNGTTSSITTDTALNGTWRMSWGLIFSEKITFLNGFFENSRLYIDPEREMFESKGTYTTNDGIINFNITHLHGNFLRNYFSGFSEIEQKWYTKTELMLYLEEINYEGNFHIDYYYIPEITTYSINGNELTFNDGSNDTTYTKIE